MQLTENKLFSILRKNHFKLTPQRRAILKTIYESKDHLTPANIYHKANAEYPGIGLVTTYRTIDVLSRLNLLCKVYSGESCQSYLLRRPLEHHHHLVCSSCGAVQEFTSCNLDGIEQKLIKETGFTVNGHLLEFEGICPDCQKTLSLKDDIG
jgi:Fur family ferric uptake transcriptional regulator